VNLKKSIKKATRELRNNPTEVEKYLRESVLARESKAVAPVSLEILSEMEKITDSLEWAHARPLF